MVNLPSPTFRRVVPEWVSRQQLLEFVHNHCPDLRIRVQQIENGKRIARADFTMQGRPLAAESDAEDVDDDIVRRCAWLVYQRLGIHRRLTDSDRSRLEREILAASARGDTALADHLGLEFVKLNEGMDPATSSG